MGVQKDHRDRVEAVDRPSDRGEKRDQLEVPGMPAPDLSRFDHLVDQAVLAVHEAEVNLRRARMAEKQARIAAARARGVEGEFRG